MAVTLATTPTYAVPKREVQLVFSGTTGDFVRVWCTEAPAGTELRRKLDALRLQAVEVEGDPRLMYLEAPLGQTVRRSFEAGGAYVFVAQEYTRVASTYGGGYDGDPNAVVSETQVGSETTITLYVGTRLEARTGSARLGLATLVLWVWDGTVRQTTEPVHGEFSPALVLATNDRARVAAASTSVQTLLDAFADQTASSLVDVADMVAEMQVEILDHFENGTAHSAADDDNDDALEALPTNAASYADPEAVHEAARVLLTALRRHMRNEDASGTTVAHHAAPDLQNLPVADIPSGSSSPSFSYVALADTWRTYEAHRVDTTAHGSADETNTLTAGNKTPLINLHAEFLRLLRAADTSSTPLGEHDAVVTLGRAGFTKST